MKAWVLGLVWLVTGKLVPSQTTTGVEYKVEIIASPKGDSRKYRLLQLENDMEVLIVRQPLFKSLVVLDVRVGMRHDPPQRRGLTHLYEHSLFNYRLSNAFNETLDMFADTLITPKFAQSAIPLDINVVNQEFRDKQQSDSFRFDMVSRVSGNMSHPYPGHFGGNNGTLFPKKIKSLQNDLYKIHRKYSSHRMRLVVMGSAPFSEQIETIVPLFTRIPKRKFKDQMQGDPFKHEKSTTLITTASIKDEQILLLQFKLPSITHIPFLKAEKYIAYMLSQRSKRSIAAFFTRQVWGTGIRSGISETNSDFTLFDVEITLLPQGRAWIDVIVEIVLQAIEFIKEKGVHQRYMQEIENILQMEWVANIEEQPVEQAMQIANQMHYYHPNHIVSSNSSFQFHKNIIISLLSNMTLSNLRVILSYQAAPAERQEPVFGTDYSIRQITLKHYPTPKLKLPPKNIFVLNPTELENVIQPSMNFSNANIPQPITNYSDTGGWFLPQQCLKSIVFLSISFGHRLTLDQFAMLNLITRMKFESMDDISFQLAVAQYQYAIEPINDRLEFSVWGFQHKLELVLQRLISSMKDPKIRKMKYIISKDSEIRRLENLLLEKPSNQAFDKLQYALGSIEWTNQDLIYATKGIQRQELKKYASELIREGSVLFYIQGNMKLEEATRIYHHTKKQLNLREVYHPVNQPKQLPNFFYRGSSFFYRFRLTNRNEKNSGLAFYLHTFNEKANQSESLTRMALYFLKKTFDETIRFNEQIGYDHNIDIFEGPSGGGLVITLQGRKDPGFAEQRLETFLGEATEIISYMTEKDFLGSAREFIKYSALDDSDEIKARGYWTRILRGTTLVDRKLLLWENYHQINKEALIYFLRNYVIRNAPKRRKLSIHAMSYAAAANQPKEVLLCGTPLIDLSYWRSDS